jgi:hypothetical protein
MTNSKECCNQDCNQGKDCPNRKRIPISDWVGVVLLGIVLGCIFGWGF